MKYALMRSARVKYSSDELNFSYKTIENTDLLTISL